MQRVETLCDQAVEKMKVLLEQARAMDSGPAGESPGPWRIQIQYPDGTWRDTTMPLYRDWGQAQKALFTRAANSPEMTFGLRDLS